MHHIGAQITLDQIRLHAGDAIRDFYSEFFAQHHAHETIADQNLMAQADRFYFCVPVDQVTDANHRIGEIDKPRIRDRPVPSHAQFQAPVEHCARRAQTRRGRRFRHTADEAHASA